MVIIDKSRNIYVESNYMCYDVMKLELNDSINSIKTKEFLKKRNLMKGKSFDFVCLQSL